MNRKRRLNRAASYVRVSANRQRCSARQQMEVIHKYAKRRGLKIVKQYADASRIQTGNHGA
jgi:DNA invertase Pin-like site-specific DNA recombinase